MNQSRSQNATAWWTYTRSILWLAVPAFLLFLLRTHVNLTTIALVFIVTITSTAMLYGSRPALLNSLLATLVLNFFFIPPIYSWTIRDAENWIAFTAFAVTALMVGQLSSRAKQSALQAEARRVEIERLYDELQRAFGEASHAEALRKSERLKSALLDAVTHDLRTPLTAIKASATALLDADTEAEAMPHDVRAELLTVIDEESDRLNKFVEQMMELAQIEGGQFSLNRHSESALVIVDEALDRCTASLRTHPVEVSVAADLPRLKVDAATISTVLVELIENAAKYSDEGAPIRISAETVANEFLRLSVKDRGMGISPEERQRVFEKFYRNPQGRARGFGMGLSIARGIVEAHGGRIWVDPNPAGGSVFSIEIPCEASA